MPLQALAADCLLPYRPTRMMNTERSQIEQARRGAALLADEAARATVRASPVATSRFADRHASQLSADFYRSGPGDIRLSSIGIGTYLGECDDADDARYERAIRAAVSGGVNVIDTAINYRCQRSERVVGRAIAALARDGLATREELLVCTKGGYIPLDGEVPASREAYQDMVAREYLEPGLMTADDIVAGGHCLAPRFLEDQVRRSRANLGVATIDVYYLHNPEQQRAVLSVNAFRDRLMRAFEALEARAAAGDIAVYGCATWNGLRAPRESREHLSLEDLINIANAVAGRAHHFRAIQLPISLAMSEAVRLPNQRVRGHDVTLLQAASELGLSVFASASLMQSKLARDLPPAVRDALPPLDTDAQRAIAFVRGMPGVTTALVGMREPSHVTENLGAAAPAAA
jgi:aryl-alcohol dehydrogenase-like predicted oxidoreductase